MRLEVALPSQGALAKPRDPGLCCLTPLAYPNQIRRHGECLLPEYAEGVTEQSPGSRGLASAPWVLGKKAQSRVLGPARYGTYSCSAPKEWCINTCRNLRRWPIYPPNPPSKGGEPEGEGWNGETCPRSGTESSDGWFSPPLSKGGLGGYW